MARLLGWLTQRPRRLAGVTALGAWLLALLLGQAGTWQRLDLAAYDLMLGLQPARAPSPVTLVTITEADIRALNAWPVPDTVLAQAILRALEGGAAVVGVDLYRDFPIAGGPPDGPSLEAVLRDNPEVVFPMFLGSGDDRVEPPAVLRSDGPRVGFADMVLDGDGVVRRGLLYADDGQRVYRSLALQVALRAVQAEGLVEQNDGDAVRIGRTRIPRLDADAGGYVDVDSAGYQFLLDFGAHFEPERRYNLLALLHGLVPRADLEGRVVMLGVTAPSIKDVFGAPRGVRELPEDVAAGGMMPGVYVQAHIVDQVLRMARGESRPMQRVPGYLEQLWVLGWALAGAWWGSRARRPLALLGSGSAGVLLIAGGSYGLFRLGYWLPGGVAPMLAGLTAMGAMVGETLALARRRENRARRLFVSQVGPEIAQWLEHQAEGPEGRLPSLDLTVTVFFSDLVGFSGIMERQGARASIQALNECMAAVRRVIMAHQGVVLQYFGDAVFAVFGAPVPRRSEAEVRQDATNAVRCAAAINAELIRINDSWRRRGWLQGEARGALGMRIGINTGPVVAGSIGERQFWRYTLFGPTVNIASRLETLHKESFRPDPERAPCRVLLTHATRTLLPESFEADDLGPFRVRNIPGTVRVYAVDPKRVPGGRRAAAGHATLGPEEVSHD